MRIIFIGASPLTIMATRMLLEKGHDIVIVEKDSEKVESLCDELDCGFVNEDGSKPAVLRELSPENTDCLFCLTDSDQDNIIAAVVAKTLGYEHIVTKLEDPEFGTVADELELVDVIVPDREVARALSDLAQGKGNMTLDAPLPNGLHLFSFTHDGEERERKDSLDLPSGARVIALSRDKQAILVESDTEIHPGDEVVVICLEEHLDTLAERFG